MTTSRKTYTAKVERSDTWWLITVDGVPFAHTQTRRLDRVEPIIHDLLVDLGVEDDPNAFDVRVTNASETVLGLVDDVIEARRKAVEAATALSIVAAGAILQMRSEGYSLRDIGALLELSHQRVQQIERAAREDPLFVKYTRDLVTEAHAAHR